MNETSSDHGRDARRGAHEVAREAPADAGDRRGERGAGVGRHHCTTVVESQGNHAWSLRW